MQDDNWKVPTMILQFFLFRVDSGWSKLGVSFVPYPPELCDAGQFL